MSKLLFFFTILCYKFSFGQNIYKGKIVTKQNDTINVEFKINDSKSEIALLIGLQEKVIVKLNDTLYQYSPKNLNSFTLMLKDKIYIFDSIDYEIFGQRMYSGNIKLHKYFKQTYVYPNKTTFRMYLIRRPNGQYSEMAAVGLSRLLTKKTMLPQIEDCEISYNKIKNDEIKIKDEEILIEFIKDYENNCFKQ